MIFISQKLLLDSEITSLDFNIFKHQSTTQLPPRAFLAGHTGEEKLGANQKLAKGKFGYNVTF